MIYMVDQTKLPASRTEEIEKKKRNRRAKVFIQILLRISLTMGIVGLIIGLGFLLDRVGYTKIKEIYITDYNLTELKLIDPEKLSEDLLSEFKGENYFLLQPHDVETKITELTTYTKNVYISKLFPNAIKVEIVERRPALILSQPERCVVLDSESYVLELVETELTESATIGIDLCPQYTELDSTEQPLLLTSDEVNTEFHLGEEAPFYVLDNLRITQQILLSEGYEVESVVFTDNIYSYQIGENRVIKMSDLEDFEIQQKRLIVILQEIATQKIDFETLDVSYERPVITRK